jgi:hypothetical protein
MESADFYEMLYKRMAFYGFNDIWFANTYAVGTVLYSPDFNERWHVGVWTGPDRDMFCLKQCTTNEQAEQWLSPGGNTIQEAFEKAVQQLNAKGAVDTSSSIVSPLSLVA